MEDIKIRQAGVSDIPIIIQIIEETWEPTYRDILSAEQIRFMQQEIYSPASLTQQMQAGQEFYILTEGEKPAGFAAYSFCGEETYKLNKIYICPDYHGLGLGKALISYVEQETRNIGGKYLILNVNRYNPAKSFYEKAGYRIIKEEDISIGPYWMNDYVLQKEL